MLQFLCAKLGFKPSGRWFQTIRHFTQSPAYQPVVKVEATEKYLKINQLESGYGPYDRSHYEVVRSIYYEDIGDIKIYHDKVWWAAIFDKSGEITLYVYPLEEIQTKRFADAVYSMMERSRE